MPSTKFVPKSTTKSGSSSKVSDENGNVGNVGSTSKNHSYYYYINEGDFDIVWTNVLVFILGHALFIKMGIDLVLNPSDTMAYSWIYGKLIN